MRKHLWVVGILCLPWTTGCGAGGGDAATTPATARPAGGGGEELDVPPRQVESTDPLVQSPALYKILLENEHARVLDVRFPAGTRDEFHEHPASVLYMVTAANLRIYRLDGVESWIQQRAGTVLVQDPTGELQAMENAGTDEFHGILFEIRQAEEPPAIQGDPVAASPGHYEVLGENDHCRVLDMKLGPGEKDEIHGHPRRLAYVIEGGRMRVLPPGGQGSPREQSVETGQILLEDPVAAHQVENVGGAEIHLLLVEIKMPPPPQDPNSEWAP